MFKYYFEQIHGVAIWPIISLSIFFIFFICLIWWVFSADKSYINKMKQTPLDDNHNTQKKFESIQGLEP